MSRIKIFKLNKWNESVDQFEKRVNDWIETTGDVSIRQAYENLYNNDVVFIFEHGEKKSVDQDFGILAWVNLTNLEEVVNSTLSGVEESERRAKHITFVSASKSDRSLCAFIVEGKRSYPASSGPELSDTDGNDQHESAKAQQDQTTDARPKRARKTKGVK
jgi:hypothetical protein